MFASFVTHRNQKRDLEKQQETFGELSLKEKAACVTGRFQKVADYPEQVAAIVRKRYKKYILGEKK